MPLITNGGPERARKRSLEEREERSCKHSIANQTQLKQGIIQSPLVFNSLKIEVNFSQRGLNQVTWRKSANRDILLIKEYGKHFFFSLEKFGTLSYSQYSETLFYLLLIWKDGEFLKWSILFRRTSNEVEDDAVENLDFEEISDEELEEEARAGRGIFFFFISM